ncbi:hypothetical protein [Pseudomonas sp. REB1044]|uniref:hypothetical protein n=1 Tax=Pseudomonas sp. REB1044 TaxID=2675224 RepID=UPI00315C9D0F
MPSLLPILVGCARPQVDDGLAAHLNAQRRTTLLGILEQGGKGVAHCLELQLKVTLNVHPPALRTTCQSKAGIVSVVGGFAY